MRNVDHIRVHQRPWSSSSGLRPHTSTKIPGIPPSTSQDPQAAREHPLWGEGGWFRLCPLLADYFCSLHRNPASCWFFYHQLFFFLIFSCPEMIRIEMGGLRQPEDAGWGEEGSQKQ